MCALYVFDKMPKWHFVVVLDPDEYQIVGITIIIHAYHVLIIAGVFYTLCPMSAYSCIGHASHMHTKLKCIVQKWSSVMICIEAKWKTSKIELQKPSQILVFDYEKGKTTF